MSGNSVDILSSMLSFLISQYNITEKEKKSTTLETFDNIHLHPLPP